MSTRARTHSHVGLVGAVKVDLGRLHGAWMELFFPRQRGRGHSVMGKWKPKTIPQKIGYYSWFAIGVLAVLVPYPFVVLGLATRYYAAKLDSARTRLGIVGVTLLAVVVWGALTLVAHLRLPPASVLAVGGASVVAVVSTTLAAVCTKHGGRPVTVLLAYPFAMTALFLPPVIAALVTPTLEPYVLEPSYDFAVWLLDNVLFVGGLNEYLRANYQLEGAAYAAMWLGFSFSAGWFLGLLVALANLVRPSESSGSD